MNILRLRRLFFVVSFSLAAAATTLAAPTVTDFHARAEQREPLSVVFFGGSITWGANASDPQRTSYRGRMMTWLREKYPRTPITFHDAAIGGTGSQLGMHRLERDVLAHRPDLVFLDFTVNDNAEGTDLPPLASYEHIVRRLLADDIAVMPVLMAFRGHVDKPDLPLPPRHQAHLKIAAAYGLPAANTIEHVRAAIVRESLDPRRDLWNIGGDAAHPGDEGYRLLFEAVRDRYEAALAAPIPTTIPSESVFENLYSKTTRLILADNLPAGWTRQKTYRTALWFDGLSSRWMGDVATASAKHKSGAIELEFEGSQIGFFGERNGLSPAVKIWIDGQPVQRPRAEPGDTLWPTDTARFAPPKKGTGNLFLWQLISNTLPEGKHTLRIEPVWEGADKDAELRIESICFAGR